MPIEHQPWWHGSTDGTLWNERQGRMARGKCQLRLLIESKLRAWLLEHHGLPLATLSFEELRLIAIGKGADARRLHNREIVVSMLRPAKVAYPPHRRPWPGGYRTGAPLGREAIGKTLLT